MAKSSATAHNEKEILKNLELLSSQEKERLLFILELITDKNIRFKPRLTITRNNRYIYVGHSIHVAMPIYIQLLEQQIRRAEIGLTLEFSFYVTSEDGTVMFIGGVQS